MASKRKKNYTIVTALDPETVTARLQGCTVAPRYPKLVRPKKVLAGVWLTGTVDSARFRVEPYYQFTTNYRVCASGTIAARGRCGTIVQVAVTPRPESRAFVQGMAR